MADQPATPAQPTQSQPLPSGGDSTLDWALKEYLTAKIQGMHIRNQGGANFVYNAGRYDEKIWGLPQASGITPFPAPVTIQQSQPAPPPTPQKETPVWQKLALGGAMLGAGAALGPVGAIGVSTLGKLLGVGQQQQTQPIVPDTLKPVIPGMGDVGIRIE